MEAGVKYILRSGDERYYCVAPGCGKSYKQIRDLQGHMVKHGGKVRKRLKYSTAAERRAAKQIQDREAKRKERQRKRARGVNLEPENDPLLQLRNYSSDTDKSVEGDVGQADVGQGDVENVQPPLLQLQNFRSGADDSGEADKGALNVEPENDPLLQLRNYSSEEDQSGKPDKGHENDALLQLRKYSSGEDHSGGQSSSGNGTETQREVTEQPDEKK
ncbi:hypothetical protein WJX72_009510 [[Myrmecia] bisecta]|uniref:C2H2-type domain-containing protein n=1 Tax=[Myrmecia] bisecta TaxID=41462 RepID=A0AAW1QT53_9CHLO